MFTLFALVETQDFAHSSTEIFPQNDCSEIRWRHCSELLLRWLFGKSRAAWQKVNIVGLHANASIEHIWWMVEMSIIKYVKSLQIGIWS